MTASTRTTDGRVGYEKYSLAGNTFLIVDETRTPLPDDATRSSFARWVLDPFFGVGGADNVLYLAHAPDGAALTFRIFEQDGSETLSCGNGLLSAGHYAARSLREAREPGGEGRAWTFLTEIPRGRPRQVRVGEGAENGHMWVNVGAPRAVPETLYRPGAGLPGHVPSARPGDPAEHQSLLEVELAVDRPPRNCLPDTGVPWPDRLSGHLVFTGEPHLVLVSAHGAPALGKELFARAPTPESIDLMEFLGARINLRYKEAFPEGVHVNFVDLGGSTPRYRTWERAINQETLACGTGALACAHVLLARHLVPDGPVTLQPHRANWHRPGTHLRVTPGPDGLVLDGRPAHICSGTVPSRQDLPPRQEIPQ
ncbi:hypothetical protein E6R18_01795 [Streptomyces sp. A1277]|uniref:hypothetical protein n=1 Tax=Streptomyces sp. A1277 TaxID=2563103 RepID=UPI0010A2505B|nr:hypothetical protein [Streptomyces sp. A1277]THA36104.1 hypothetical protein E6R18_01795 [Streptomyces sp. A1277]